MLNNNNTSFAIAGSCLQMTEATDGWPEVSIMKAANLINEQLGPRLIHLNLIYAGKETATEPNSMYIYK